jgi:hypothetical protein
MHDSWFCLCIPIHEWDVIYGGLEKKTSSGWKSSRVEIQHEIHLMDEICVKGWIETPEKSDRLVSRAGPGQSISGQPF